MSHYFDIDLAVESLKIVVDSNRCGICDKLEGSRARYKCGHTTCDECVAVTSDCILCLTPPTAYDPSLPVFDDPCTVRAKNASVLLKNFENIFKIDVYKRHRLSEQLKVEKELFPKCIQAPFKYSNKRKSSNLSWLNKENRFSFFPGEQVSPIKKLEMEKAVYVQQWLEKSDKKHPIKSPRKVFADLNVNHQNLSANRSVSIKKRGHRNLDKVNSSNSENTLQTKRKRSHFKTTLSTVEPQPYLDTYLKPLQPSSYRWNTKIDKVLQSEKEHKRKKPNIDINDESGIVMDDEPIVINDTQNQTIDKDEEACLAVLKANENSTLSSTSPLRLECNEIIKNTDDLERTVVELSKTQSKGFDTIPPYKVPFFKKTYLFETCKVCDAIGNKIQARNKLPAGQSKDVLITIESNSFITTIKVSNTSENTTRVIKHSIPIQTDITVGSVRIENTNEHSNQNIALDNKNEHEMNVHSQDLFTGETQKIDQEFVSQLKELPVLHTDTVNNIKRLAIAESDSDVDLNESTVIEVTAEVHRSNEPLESNVLHEVDENNYNERMRSVKRRCTPGSTDSSEKENYDPNKPKKFKKKVMKRKIKKHISCLKAIPIYK